MRRGRDHGLQRPCPQGWRRLTPSRASAIREILRRGLSADGFEVANSGSPSKAFGVIKGYEVDGAKIPPYTIMGGAFEHAKAHGDKPPYALPMSWREARQAGRLDLQTPLNFVSTADIIGGNSGSPVVNRDNEVVGLIFDGNIQSLVLDFGYEDTTARAVSVDSRGIMEALRSIYRADRLVDELSVR